MAKLVVSLEGGFLREYPLDKERIAIGRRPTNDIQLDNLAMSGVHATILTIGKDSFLEDIGSTNGTMVNGQSIKKHLLQHNDVIEFGKYQVKYINEALPNKIGLEIDEESFEKTMIFHATANNPVAPLVATSSARQSDSSVAGPSAMTPTATVFKPALAASAAMSSPNGRIQVLNGSNMGRELLLNKVLTTLGKPGVQVAVITRRPHGYFVTHVEGKSLPIVNGQSIGLQAHHLNDQDIIELASVKMKFLEII